MPAGNVSVEAVFEADPVTVTFNAGTGAQFAADVTTKEYEIAKGAALNTHDDLKEAEAAIPTPTKTGYSFMGWHDDSDTENANSVATIDLTAAVNADASYTAIFVKSYETFQEGKIKAVTIASSSSTKTYAQLKFEGYTTTNGDTLADGVLVANQGTSSTSGLNAGSTQGEYTLVSVDTSGIDKTRNRVLLHITSQCTDADTSKSSQFNVSDAKATITDIATVTHDDVKSSTGRFEYNTIATIATSVGSTEATVDYDITPFILAASDDVVYLALSTSIAREQSISNLSFTTTPLYEAEITVTDGTDPLENAVVTLTAAKSYDADGAVVTDNKLTTGSDGKVKFYLPAGTYPVASVALTGYELDGTVEDIEITNADVKASVTMNAESDIKYNVTVNTTPYATVALQAGTSTAGTTVEAQSKTAGPTGTVTLDGVPAGTYTVNVSLNENASKYIDNTATKQITVVNEETPVNAALGFKNTYANMIYGEDFANAVNNTSFSDTTWSAFTIDASAAWKGIRSAKTSGTANVGLHNLDGKDNNTDKYYCYSGGSGSGSSTVITVNDSIASVSFDYGYDQAGNKGGGAYSAPRDNNNVTIKIGDTDIAYVKWAASNAGTVEVKGQTAVAVVNTQWLHFDISVNGEGVATVTISGIKAGESASSTLSTGTVSDVGTTTKTISFNGSKNNGKWPSFGLDNIEIYKAAE